MSFFGNIIKDLKSWASKFEHLLGEFAAEAPTFEKIAASTLTFIGPILQTVVSLTAGAPAGAIVGAIVSKAQTDLAAASGLLTVIGPTPSVASILSGVVSDLSGLYTLAGIKDAETQSKIDLVVKELQALVDSFPAAAASPAPAPAPAPLPAPAPAPVVIELPAPALAPAPEPAPAPAPAPAAASAKTEHSGLAPA